MADREKVIQHFQDAIEASGNNNKWRFVRLDIIEDAIKLLKAQDQLCNVDIPEGVTEKQFYAVMSNVVEALYPDFAKDVDVLT